jgi:hypothetical protein
MKYTVSTSIFANFLQFYSNMKYTVSRRTFARFLQTTIY